MAKQGFVIHHNGPNANCLGKPHSKCVSFWNGVRDYHMNTKGWSDIAYSFGMCPHGTRFTGRGWFKNQFANGTDNVGVDDGKDSEWYTVLVFLGWNDDWANPLDEQPTPAMIAGVTALITEGRKAEYCDMRILPHNAFKVKRCPGEYFTNYANKYTDKPFVTPTEPKPDPTIPSEDDMFTLFYDQQAEQYWFMTPWTAGKLTDDEGYLIDVNSPNLSAVPVPTTVAMKKILNKAPV